MRRFLTQLFLVFVVITGNAAPNNAWQPLADALKQPQKAQFIEINAESDELLQFRNNMKRFTALQGLKISGTTASEPCNGLFRELAAMPQLQTLDLSFNDFTVMPEALRGLQQLKHLAVWGNETMDYDDFFKKAVSLTRLQSLELSNTELAEIPASLGYLRQLRSLEIGVSENMDMDALCETVAALPLLNDLKLEVFDLGELPESVFKLENIKNLNIGLLREDEETLGNDDHLFVETYNLSTNRKLPLAVSFTASTRKLDADEKEMFCELSGYSDNKSLVQPLPVEEVPQEFVPFNRVYKNVKQPIPGVDVPKDLHVIKAEEGTRFFYPTGTEVVIPKNAFVDAAGKPIKGDVVIDYREFRDPVDFIVSGIPMTYNENGEVRNFESAGMFEINASVNGQEVFLAPDKRVNVDLALNDSAEKYNFYKFNAQAGAWDDAGKAGTTKPMTDPQRRIQQASNTRTPNNSEAARAYMQWKSKGEITWYDTTGFEKRFEDPYYFYTKRVFSIKKDSYITTRSKKGQRKNFQNKNLIRFKRVNSENKGEYCFQIIHWGTKHPELGALHNQVWKVDEPLTATQFRKKYTVKKRYSDIRLESDGATGYTLRLKSLDGIVEMPVSPYVAPNKKDENVYKNAASNYRQYKRQLKSRKRSFDKRIRKEKGFVSYTYTRSDSAGAWAMITMMMSPKEKAMSHAEWKALYGLPEKISKENKSVNQNDLSNWGTTKRSVLKTVGNVLWGASIGVIATGISIASLGTFNCDRFQMPFDPYKDNSVQVFASYQDQTGAPLANKTTYILNQGINGMLTYETPLSGTSLLVKFGKIKGNLMLVIDEKGEVSYFTPADFKTSKEEKMQPYTYKMRSNGTKITSRDELRSLVNDQKLFAE